MRGVVSDHVGGEVSVARLSAGGGSVHGVHRAARLELRCGGTGLRVRWWLTPAPREHAHAPEGRQRA